MFKGKLNCRLYSVFHHNHQASSKSGYQKMTVAAYLKKRLELLKVTRLFGVPGNYTAPLLNTILEDEKSPIKLTTMSNELVSGYAADGYTRVLGRDGVGAVHVTYGVGAMVLFNAVAGSFVEDVPIVVINGAPTNKEFILHEQQGLIYQHFDQNKYSNIDVYRNYTVSAQRINNAIEAPLQIDQALTACLTKRKPVYLEVFEDVWRAECEVPVEFKPITHDHYSVTNEDLDVAAAVDETVTRMEEILKLKHYPVFVAGIEVQRYGLQENFRKLIDASNYYFTTNSFSKSTIEESHPNFITNATQQCTEHSLTISLGIAYTGQDTGNTNIKAQPCRIILYGRGAFIGEKYFGNVPLGKFMDKLAEKFKQGCLKPDPSYKSKISNALELSVKRKLRQLKEKDSEAITYAQFATALSDDWTSQVKDVAVVVDVSFPLIALSNLRVNTPNSFISQANWLAIGYGLGGAVGVKLAHSDGRYEPDLRHEPKGDKRVIVCSGDGSFQETCQAISAMVQLGQNNVIFVLDNTTFGVEQQGVNPNPFRSTGKVNYEDKYHTTQAKLLDELYSYNLTQQWNYSEFGKLVGGERPDSKVQVVGKKVTKVSELKAVIKEIRANPKKAYIVHVVVPPNDSPTPADSLAKTVGEDEILNPSFPPKNTF